MLLKDIFMDDPKDNLTAFAMMGMVTLAGIFIYFYFMS